MNKRVLQQLRAWLLQKYLPAPKRWVAARTFIWLSAFCRLANPTRFS
jgi:hypothetical protein